MGQRVGLETWEMGHGQLPVAYLIAFAGFLLPLISHFPFTVFVR